MKKNEFLELNLPLGTKVKHKDKLWFVVGYNDQASETIIQLAREVKEARDYAHCDTTTIHSYDELEVISYPVKYATLPKYHTADVVFHGHHKCMVLDERNVETQSYLVFNYVENWSEIVSEDELTTEMNLDELKVASPDVDQELKNNILESEGEIDE